MKKTFVSIPITGKDINEVKKHIAEIDFLLTDKIINPIEYDEWELGKDWEWYMVRTLDMLKDADCIFMCRGWEYSKGCRLEHEFAKYHNIEIKYESSFGYDIF